MIIEKNCKSIKDILNNDIQVNGIIYSPIFGDLEYLGTDESPRYNPWAKDGSRGGDILRGKANWYRQQGR